MESEEEPKGAAAETEPGTEALSAAQRARVELQRRRALALRRARLAPHSLCAISEKHGRALDSGGGFLLEEEPVEVRAGAAPPAPLVEPGARPACLHCGRPVAHSYLLDTFEHAACDACRDDEGAHALVTRTEAKDEFLLKDCDLDLRSPPLRCVRRRNPRGARLADMRLYLRAQVEARALAVWGGAAELEAERARREEARATARASRARRRLRALRMDVRSAVYAGRTGAAESHRHEFGVETYDAAADEYRRECVSCGHLEIYEKM